MAKTTVRVYRHDSLLKARTTGRAVRSSLRVTQETHGCTQVPLAGAGVCTVSLWGVSSRVLPAPAAILGYSPV